ncbi:UNVERIFIED_ORG: hypothetical protein J2Y78_004907 [Buttiauxella agrestis ATCC 33320]
MSVFISKKLKYFMITMEKKCILKSAEALYITRTPLCKILSDIEQDLGGKLFSKSYNTLEPTELAWHYYYKLLDPYEALMKVESEIKDQYKYRKMKIVFDIGIPEMLFRISCSMIQSEIIDSKIEITREVLHDETLKEHKYDPNILFISLRDISHMNYYKIDKWLSIQYALMARNDYDGTVPIYLWRDSYSGYFSKKIKELIEEEFPKCNVFEHNLEFYHILYNVSVGKGAVILPIKLAAASKTNNVDIFPIRNKFSQLTFYHNLNQQSYENYEKIKKVLNMIF